MIDVAAQKSGWATEARRGPGARHRGAPQLSDLCRRRGRGRGRTGGAVRIPRIDIALDPGLVVDPDRVRAQFEGAAVFGAGIAMFSEMTASGGRMQQSNFNGYRVARMNEAPVETHVHIVRATPRRRASASPAFRR